MPSERPLEPRVSSLETEVKSLSQDIQNLAGTVERAIAMIRAEIERPKGIQLATLLSAVSLAVIIIGAIGTAYVAPLYGRVSGVERVDDLERVHLKEGIANNAAYIAQLEKLMTLSATEQRALSEKFREVETQFRWGTDINNMRNRNFDRFLAIVWQELFKVPLPDANLPSAGPNHPNGR